MDNKTSFILEIVDKASQALDKIDEKLAKFNASMKDIENKGKNNPVLNPKPGSAPGKEIVTGMERMAEAAQLASGPLGTLGTSIANLSQRAGNLGPAVVGAALAIYVLQKAVVESIRAAADYEEQMATLEAVIKATGGAAGKTAGEIDELAGKLSSSTLFTDDQVRQASAVLLTFKSIQGVNFDNAIKSSADLAAVMGTDMKGAALQLGKAMEDPDKGLTALARSGVSFTDVEKEMIKAMVDAGRQADAQRIILKALEAQVGGAAEAQGSGLNGAVHRLADSWNNFLEALGGNELGVANEGLRELADLVDRVNTKLTGGKIGAGVSKITDEVKGIDQAIKAAGDDKDLVGNLEKAKANLLELQKVTTDNKDTLAEAMELSGKIQNLEADLAKTKTQADAATGTSAKEELDASVRLRQEYIDKLKGDLAALGTQYADFETNLAKGVASANLARQAVDDKKAAADAVTRREASERELTEVVRKGGEDRAKLVQEQHQQELEQQRIRLDEEFKNKTITEAEYSARALEIKKKQQEVEVSALADQRAALQKQYDDRAAALQAAAATKGMSFSAQDLDTNKDLVTLKQQIATIDQQRATTDASHQTAILQEQASLDRTIEQKQKELKAEQDKTAEKNKQLDLQVRNAQNDSVLNDPVANLNTAQFDEQVNARIDAIKAKYASLLDDLAKQGRTADISVVNKIVDKESVQAQFDQLNALLDQQLNDFALRRQAIEQQFGVDPTELQQDTIAKQIEDEFAKAKVQIDATQQAMKDLAAASGDPAIARGLEQVAVKTKDVELSTKSLTDSVTKVKDAYSQGVGDALGKTIGDVASGAKSAEDAWKEFATEFIKLTLQMIAKLVLLKATESSGGAGGGAGGAVGFFTSVFNAMGASGGAAGGGYFDDKFARSIQHFSHGGAVHGPGTTTSDSIRARLSRGEYVVRAAAVKHYGVGLFELLNRMALGDMQRYSVSRITRPKIMAFSAGGYVSAATGEKSLYDAGMAQRSFQVDVVNVRDEDETRNYILSKQGQKDLMVVVNNNQRRVRNISSGAV